MLISVLIAAYKAGPHIGKALDSVASQTHTNWELIVVEDGSHDETERLVSEFSTRTDAPRVRYENNGKNLGVAQTRNRLMELAKGEAMAFLDADDTWEPGHLANAVQALAAGADLVVAGVRAFDLGSGLTLSTHKISDQLEENPVGALFRESLIVTSSAVTLRRALTQKAGTFLTDLKVGEDRDYWIRCAKAGARFSAAPQTCNYAKHQGSTMARTGLVAEQEVLFLEKYGGDTQIPAKLRIELLSHARCNLGRLLRDTSPKQATRLLLKAWRQHPLQVEAPAQLAYTLLRRMISRRTAPLPR